MASPLTLTVAGGGSPDDVARAEAAWGAVIVEFDRCEDAMSRFRDDSEITRLNRHLGRAVAGVSPRLARALAASDRARRLTDGRFDPRVVAALEAIGYAGAALGEAGLADGGRPRPGGRVVDVDRRARTWRLSAPVDLGGIGKGLALRWAAAQVAARLPGRGFLLDAGGDLVGRAPATDGPAWRIGIEDPNLPPDASGAPVAVVELVDGSIATSSVRRNRWPADDGREVHHLIDPRTSAPVDSALRAVTVAHADPAWAEVWAKALFVGGAATIGPEARSRGLAAWWIDADGVVSMTPAARVRTLWPD